MNQNPHDKMTPSQKVIFVSATIIGLGAALALGVKLAWDVWKGRG